MSSLISLIKSSSAPQAYQSDASLAAFAEAFAKGVIKRLARCVAADPAAQALFACCTEMLGRAELRTVNCWQPELGACMERMKQGQPLEAVVHALLSLHALGVPGTWSLSLAAPLRVSMGGHIFNLHGTVEVAGDGARLHCSVADGACAPLRFAHQGGRWRLEGTAEAPWDYAAPAFVGYAGFETCYVQPWLLPGGHQPGDDLMVDWPPQPADAHCTQLAQQAAAQMGEALDMLNVAGARYLPWLRPVMRGIAACPVYEPGVRVSASFPNHLGVISAGFPLKAAYLAEILVHEFSHQYYLLLDAVTPLVKKQDEQPLFYSSFKMKQRPLGKIFLAYHATANMALFWHDLHANSGVSVALYADELTKLLYHTDSLGSVIASSAGLTAAGAAMFETQRDLLKERGLLNRGDLLGCAA
ncbi:aKG-HExxH-type peptide beta-hydroxylase [Massilia sp. TSP1-1-2]|uniref:aKG-HExxH-type peptide beta-hydroxylase n=1 Tax=unclassified Massilia TaxID=2609279 RepID=UPI003CEEB6F2